MKDKNIRGVLGDKSNCFTLIKKEGNEARVLEMMKLKQFKKICKQRKNTVRPILKTQVPQMVSYQL